MKPQRFTALRAGELTAAVDQLAKSGLTWASPADFSIRAGAGFLLTPSSRALDEVNEATLAYCTLDGEPPGGLSVATPLHREIYRTRAEIGAVVQASPFYATLVASSGIELDPRLTIQSVHYLQVVLRVPFHPPGAPELGQAVARASLQADALLLENYCAVVMGGSAHEAVQRLVALESLCRMAVYAALGVPVRPLSDGDVRRLVDTLGDQRDA